jgi:hypothetical protein
LDRYQQALHRDRTDPGERDSEERWLAIGAELPDEGMVLDVGSNLGYFGLRAVQEHAGLAVVSVESSAPIAERQRRLLDEHETTRVCLVRGRFDSATARDWATTCDWFEMTLVLSILHWMDDPAEVVRSLSSMSAVLIAEVPDSTDSGACGGAHRSLWGSDPVSWFNHQTGRESTLLARIHRHTSDVPSHLIRVSGPVSRRPTVPYWGYGYGRQTSDSYEMAYDGRSVSLQVRGEKRDYRPGVNVVSLTRLGTLLHPRRAYWDRALREALDAAPNHPDPYLHNMLWTPRGLDLIDDSDLAVERSREQVLGTYGRNLDAWERGRARGYIREILSPRQLIRRGVGRVIRRVFGEPAAARIKRMVDRSHDVAAR